MTTLAPARRPRGLAALTRSGSPVDGAAWALYDFANTIFSFAIVSFAMGPWATSLLGETNGTVAFTVASSASVGLNALVSPVLGAMSDRTGGRMRYLLVFTVLCIVPTALIGFLDIGLGLLAFALANFAYQAALIYYDALLPDVARTAARGRLSGIGVALGYVGAIVAALLFRVTTDADGNTTAVSFVLMASLFAVFAIPIFLLVRERQTDGAPFRLTDAGRSFGQLRVTVAHARQRPGLLRFIVGRFFYSDPINTAIAVMSLFAIHAVGFTPSEALFVLTGLIVAAVIASFGWGILCDRIGPKRTLMLVLASWTVGLLIIGLFLAKIPFLIAGVILGSGLGGVAVTDRLYLLRLARPEEVGEMFGLYGLAGKLSAVIGPLLYGGIILLLDPERIGPVAYQVAILSLLVLMVIGVLIVRGVPEPPATDDGVGAGLTGFREGDPSMTIVVAHRGASRHRPENTLASFALGVEQGADAIELDLHVSQDGELVVIHDDTLDRTTDLTGSVASLSMSDIRRADAGARFAGTDGSFPFRGQGLTVPTFGEVLDWLPHGVGLVVEIKARSAVALAVEALRGHRVRTAGWASLISFDERAIDESRDLDPGLSTGYLLVPGQPFEPALRYAVEHLHPAVHPYEGDLGMDPAPMIAQARAYGRDLGCYVVNDPERMQLLAAYGLWGFVTDVPDMARSAVPRATA